jgi:hypothetical protein
MRELVRRLVLGTAVAGCLAVTLPASADTPNFTPYRHPTFHCPKVFHYGNGEGPKIESIEGFGGTLCVTYNKRDITADNGGAIRFALAEPARFAVAGKCQYWQRDHWKIRVDHGFGGIVQWDGSYWWDLRNGYGAAIMRHFKLGGSPVGARQAAAAVAMVSPPLANQIRKYGGRGGGAGAAVVLPSGIGC